MLYYKQFKSFNPLTDYFPESPFSYLPKIGWRARSLLTGCSIEQIEMIAKRISNEIESYYFEEKDNAIHELKSKFRNGEFSEEEFERFFYWDGGSIANGLWIFRDGMEEEFDIPRENSSSEVDALKSILEKRDGNFFNTDDTIEPPANEYPEGKDYQLFSVMALWFIVDALESINHAGTHAKSIAGDYLIEAMDAVSHAEHLREKEWLISYSEVVKQKALSDEFKKQSDITSALREQAKQDHIKSLNDQRSNFAKKGVNARLANDPIQLAKTEIIEEYEKRNSQFKRRGYSAQFAREMLKKYPVITSIKTIDKLISKLNKINVLIPR